MVCGDKLEYRSTPEPRTCYFCGEVKPGAIFCANGHYVCDACHGKDALKAVSDIAFSTGLSDPLAIAEQMMSHPSVPMIGGEHHAIVASALAAALKNYGGARYDGTPIGVNDIFIERAIDRAWTDRLPSCMCANYGMCGVAPAAGAIVSLLTDATCDTPKAKERQLAMEVTNYVGAEVARFRGTCCKLSTRLAIEGACIALREYFGVELARERTRCVHKKRNPYKCFGPLCPYAKEHAS